MEESALGKPISPPILSILQRGKPKLGIGRQVGSSAELETTSPAPQPTGSNHDALCSEPLQRYAVVSLSSSQHLPMQEFQVKVIFGSFSVADSEPDLFKCRNSADTLIARPQWEFYFPFPPPPYLFVSLSLLCVVKVTLHDIFR